MLDSQKFPFIKDIGDRILPAPMPYLNLTVNLQEVSQNVFGLLDTGSTVSVLPYRLGLELGAIWEEHNVPLVLAGNLANFEANAILLEVQFGKFEPVKLAFAWTKAENAPLILGQTNFFMEFDICFYRSQNEFTISKK